MRSPKIGLFGAASLWLLSAAAAAQGLVNIPAKSLGRALDDYIRQSGVQLIYSADDVAGLTSKDVHGATPEAALARLLDGTGLTASRDASGAVVISRATAAQARDQDVPIAEMIVVTGSRIRGGNDETPPVTNISSDELWATTPGSIPEALNKLPVFMGGSTPNNITTGANGSGYNTPGYFLNLRNLGAIRTLVLQDGHRVPGTFYDTTVDVEMLPQMLVSHVEIVTGGASAVYGSDAVTGVVNFILDSKFDGLKAVLQGGISDYGDAKSFRAGLAGGEDIGTHGHLIWSVEYRDRDALPDAAARPLGNLGTSIVGAGTAASPYMLVTGIRQSNTAPGGLIVSGPGKGLQFLSDGSLGPFNPGTPTATTNFSIGGDGGIEHNEYLLPVSDTGQGFARFSWDFGDTFSAHAEARYALARTFEAGQIFTNVNGSGLSTNGSSAQYPITIYSGNAFLTPAEQALLFPAGGPASFQMNRMDNDLMSRLSLDQHTGALALGAGIQGVAWGAFAWDLDYSHGETRTQLTTRNNVNTARFYAALDAVRDPATGNIVCNVTLTAPGAFPGCVPLDLFGQSATVVNGSNASQAALNYVSATTWWVAHNGLDDFSADITGTAFRDWAGPVKVALGAEYRLADLNVTTSTPDNSFNPQYLRLAPPGTFASTAASPNGTFPPADLANFKEVQSGAQGSEHVAEADVEFDAPVLRDLPGIEFLSVNGAARYTRYDVGGLNPTASGRVKADFSAATWKLGADWQVIDALKLHATRSRDIRAPTLWDLFQGPVTSTSGISDSLTGASGSANTLTVGNPALKPEVANNTTLGLIYMPGWLQNLSVSIDYFHILVAREIATVTGGNPVVQSLCLASPGGSSPYCALIQRPISYNSTSPLNFPTLFYSQAQNFQRQWTEGVDFDVSYHTDLASWSDLAGWMNVRLLWTHTSFLKTLGLPGSVITNDAGSSNGPVSALPTEKGTLMIDYSKDRLTVDVMERYYGSLRHNPNPTLIYAPSMGDLPAYFQTDLNVAYDFTDYGAPVTGFLSVDNLFDTQPRIFQVPGYTGSPGMNYPVVPYEDIIGRYFTLGVRLKLD
ncbi:MAG TPA: TonB-dependent receptor [Rhizomicrobium sp.]|nr:TonB-dependent receptor [Rhizomicrobium sp.]